MADALPPKRPDRCKLRGREKRVDASDQGLNRVESRDQIKAARVTKGLPEALVAPPDGTRTADLQCSYRPNTSADA
jgi:hypothetical protein